MNSNDNPSPPQGLQRTSERIVRSRSELLDAASAIDVISIVCMNSIDGLHHFALNPKVTLRGFPGTVSRLEFISGEQGIALTRDNCLVDIEVCTDSDQAAISASPNNGDWGILELRNLVVTGRVLLEAQGTHVKGHVQVCDLHIRAADASQQERRPSGYGVNVKQGAFTLWNLSDTPESRISADLIGISIGLPGAPVYGSGIFVSGSGEAGGQVFLTRLEAGPIFSDGRILPNTADLISGGVFIVQNVIADEVVTRGPVSTYGPNDMALDNWGTVEKWTSCAPVKTYGASGVGFVNFGTIGRLIVKAPIETAGQGARGFNVYTGTVKIAEFDRIVTHGDGAVGIQVSQPVGHITVHRGIETFGSKGDSLVKGVIQQLPATAVSVKEGGLIEKLSIRGGIRTHGRDVPPLESHGLIKEFHLSGGMQGETHEVSNSQPAAHQR